MTLESESRECRAPSLHRNLRLAQFFPIL